VASQHFIQIDVNTSPYSKWTTSFMHHPLFFIVVQLKHLLSNQFGDGLTGTETSLRATRSSLTWGIGIGANEFLFFVIGSLYFSRSYLAEIACFMFVCN
jgi:hypothetical protein